ARLAERGQEQRARDLGRADYSPTNAAGHCHHPSSPWHYPGMTDLFRGMGVALLTMFGDDGAVDPGATGELAAGLVERGMRARLVAGTTGEAATLADAERCALIEAGRGASPPRVPLLPR